MAAVKLACGAERRPSDAFIARCGGAERPGCPTPGRVCIWARPDRDELVSAVVIDDLREVPDEGDRERARARWEGCERERGGVIGLSGLHASAATSIRRRQVPSIVIVFGKEKCGSIGSVLARTIVVPGILPQHWTDQGTWDSRWRERLRDVGSPRRPKVRGAPGKRGYRF